MLYFIIIIIKKLNKLPVFYIIKKPFKFHSAMICWKIATHDHDYYRWTYAVFLSQQNTRCALKYSMHIQPSRIMCRLANKRFVLQMCRPQNGRKSQIPYLSQ